MQSISVLISFSGQGGVERMVLNLVQEMSLYNINIDLVAIRSNSEHLKRFMLTKPDNVNLVRLKSNHTLTCIPELRRYMLANRPEAMLVAKDRAGRAALIARQLSDVKTRIVIRLGTNLSTALASKSALQRWLRTAPMRTIYKKVDAVAAVSEGVRQDTATITRLPLDKITVIRNPVITPDFYEKASDLASHKWLTESVSERDVPVIMSAGRLSYQKDFHSLLRAVALVNQTRPVRLIILGEGKDRESLRMLANELGISGSLDLPGFADNLYGWLCQANLFVLSSRWEGSPNVLTEALALGVPSVSTRCPSGPNEVLAEGRFGLLSSVGDVDSMANHILQTLDSPLPAEVLKEAVSEYSSNISADRYLELLGVKPFATKLLDSVEEDQ